VDPRVAGVSRIGHMATPRLTAKAVLRYDQVRETHLLLLPERVVQLNRSSAAILALCDGSKTIEAIVAHLEAQFATGDLTPDVTAFLRDAHQHGWVEA
jgi:pyrroloquinoline quinone biosynthesis protein D